MIGLTGKRQNDVLLSNVSVAFRQSLRTLIFNWRTLHKLQYQRPFFLFNPLSANPKKWSDIHVGCCLGLALNGLICYKLN